MFTGKDIIEKVLMALSEQLEAEGAGMVELVVCGGAALNILGLVRRTTKDIDVIAFAKTNKKGSPRLIKADSLCPELARAAEKVGRDFNLPENWLNTGPASVMDFGLPEGLMERVETKKYSNTLIIHFLCRYDQIHFKLFAAVDRGRPDVHFDDLMALKPTDEELEAAARWSLTHDSSPGYRNTLKVFLKKIGRRNVASRL